MKGLVSYPASSSDDNDDDDDGGEEEEEGGGGEKDVDEKRNGKEATTTTTVVVTAAERSASLSFKPPFCHRHAAAAKRKRAPSSSSTADRATSAPLPPLPPAFHDLYATNVRAATTDDPLLHAGRTRATPHIPGNWPSHVYVEWFPPPEQSRALHSLLRFPAPSGVRSLLFSDLSVPQPLHVSLSRSLNFVAADKDVFVSALRSEIRADAPPPFALRASALRWVSNFEGTRWFLVVGVEEEEEEGGGGGGGGVGKGNQKEGGREAVEGDEEAKAARSRRSGAGGRCPRLNQLLATCNGVAAAFHQPLLYTAHPAALGPLSEAPALDVLLSETHDASDKFHVSIAWAPAKPDPEPGDIPSSTGTGTSSTSREQRELQEILDKISIEVRCVKVKTGNIITTVNL